MVLIQPVSIRILVGYEDDSVISPCSQIIFRCRPDDLFAAAIGLDQRVMGTIDIYPHLARIVRVLKEIWFAVRNVLP